jgi:CO dehydrogenase/acetyl-CoA synthase epsilon subunit
MKRAQPLIIVGTNLKADLVVHIIRKVIIERGRPSDVLSPTKKKRIITEGVQSSFTLGPFTGK